MGDDVDDPLGEPELLHARVTAVRRARRLVRHHLREVETKVAPAVHPGRDLRPDDAAERLVAEVRARVVERLRPERRHRAVGHHRDLGIEEPALVSVGHRLVEVRPPLGPLHRAPELAGEQAERHELRVRRDLVPERAPDVLGDHAQLVGSHPERGRHHDRREAGELVVAGERPLAGTAVVFDERAVRLERRRVEAVEVELRDLDDVVGLGERLVDVAPLPHAGVGDVSTALLVEHRGVVLEGLAGVDDDVERLVVDHHELRGVAGELARLGHDRHDGLAEVAHLADRERVVLDVRRRARPRSGRTGRSGSRPRRRSASRRRRAARARR